MSRRPVRVRRESRAGRVVRDVVAGLREAAWALSEVLRGGRDESGLVSVSFRRALPRDPRHARWSR